MNAKLNALVAKLPKGLQGVAKALVPGVVTVGAVAAEAATSGTVNTGELVTAGLGVLTALATYFVPNLTPVEKDVVQAVVAGVEGATKAADGTLSAPGITPAA